MFKLYKKLRPIDWVLLIVLVGLTVLQVYCTMLLVDYTKDIIQSITLLDYFNHPEKLDEAGALAALIGSLGGWGNVTAEALAAAGVEGSKAGELMKIASASTGDIWRSGGLMLAVALGSAAAQCAVGLIASYVSAGLSTNIRSAVYKLSLIHI